MNKPSVRLSRHVVAISGVAELPVLSLQAAQDGPVAVITANLHGDECTGIGVVHRLRSALPDLLLKGTVHLYPSLNPAGLRDASRGLPGDDRDPNRAFPGDAAGSLAERLDDAVYSDILGRQPDLLIDLHTDSGRAIPYAILDRVCRGPQRRALASRCHALAQASGLTVLHEYPRPRYLRYHLDHSLTGALLNGPAIPALTLEVGPRRGLFPAAVDTSLRATLGVLHELGLVDAPAPRHPTRVGGGPWRRENGPRCSHAGVLEVIAAPGVVFSAGEIIARVRRLDGRSLQEIAAAEPGFVVAVPDRCWVNAASSCATLAVQDRR